MRDRAYKRYLLTTLLVILAFNFADRYALGILLQDIKVDLDLSDTQLGLLSGIAFALFYSVLGVPIARWADRGNRVTIISLSAAVGGVMVALCGSAGSFVQLLLIRIGVATGEAGCIPPAHSLIADHFSRAERPRAVSTYMLGIPLSMMVAYFFAGWINELYGWRTTFMVLGLPGLGTALLAWLTLREPRTAANVVRAQPAQPALREVWITLLTNATFRHLLLCYSVMYFFWGGIGKWLPVFFIRSHGLGTGELGTWFAVIWGGGGLIGTYLGGALASRYAAHNERLQIRVMAILVSSFGLFSAGVYLSQSLYLAFGLMGVAVLGLTATSGPVFATVQTLVPERMRAMSIAVIHLFANLIGMGLGPLAAGALSDAFRPWAGQESLRYALLILSSGYLWAGWHMWQASRTVFQDLERVHAR